MRNTHEHQHIWRQDPNNYSEWYREEGLVHINWAILFFFLLWMRKAEIANGVFVGEILCLESWEPMRVQRVFSVKIIILEKRSRRKCAKSPFWRWEGVGPILYAAKYRLVFSRVAKFHGSLGYIHVKKSDKEQKNESLLMEIKNQFQ